MGAESSRIKATDAPVDFTARGEVMLMSKGSVSNRNEFTKRVTEAELLSVDKKRNLRSKSELPREFEPKNVNNKKKPPKEKRWLKNWWALRGSNSRPSRCKRDALPAELSAHLVYERCYN